MYACSQRGLMPRVKFTIRQAITIFLIGVVSSGQQTISFWTSELVLRQQGASIYSFPASRRSHFGSYCTWGFLAGCAKTSVDGALGFWSARMLRCLLFMLMLCGAPMRLCARQESGCSLYRRFIMKLQFQTPCPTVAFFIPH